MAAQQQIRVLIADDHPLVREGLKRLVSDQKDMQLVAEAAHGEEAVAMAQATHPAVVLLDMSMAGWDGVTTARALREACPETRIIVVTRHTDRTIVDRMFELGAAGYVLKQSSSTELTRAIRVVSGGGRYLDPELQTAPEPPARPDSAFPSEGERGRRTDLTTAEERVLRLVAQSYSNREIAAYLSTSTEAVADLKRQAMAKARLTTRLHVIRYAEECGWTGPR